MTAVPAFRRLYDVSRLPAGGDLEALEASSEEREALARRFGLDALHALTAKLKIARATAAAIKVSGEARAEIAQTCVLTLERFGSALAFPVEEVFRTARGGGGRLQAVEAFDDDGAPLIVGQSIDLGELVAQELGMTIDPYPKAPGAAFEPPASAG
ncbi:MAG: YceD family protein [Hyphomicrobiales bacterium]